MNVDLQDFLVIIKDTLFSLLPLVLIFLIFQIISLKLSKRMFSDILLGMILTFVGLSLFMQGVTISFIGSGQEIGKTLGVLDNNLFLILMGFLLGFVVTLAEPAVQVLKIEVEKASSGYINKKMMLAFLSFGVACSVALSLIRILAGWPLWMMLLPLYITALLIARFVNRTFVAIAFDAGGVVTGPMIATFLLSLMIGVSVTVEGSNPLIDGFGMISMVAVVPIITVLILGLLYDRKLKKEEKVNE